MVKLDVSVIIFAKHVVYSWFSLSMVGSVAHCAALWGWPFVNKSKPDNLDTLMMHCAVHEKIGCLVSQLAQKRGMWQSLCIYPSSPSNQAFALVGLVPQTSNFWVIDFVLEKSMSFRSFSKQLRWWGRVSGSPARCVAVWWFSVGLAGPSWPICCCLMSRWRRRFLASC